MWWLRGSLSTTHLAAAEVIAMAQIFAHQLGDLWPQGLRWEASGGRPGMSTTYLNFMDTVYKKYPSASNPNCAGHEQSSDE
jgi:hypothetical protein